MVNQPYHQEMTQPREYFTGGDANFGCPMFTAPVALVLICATQYNTVLVLHVGTAQTPFIGCVVGSQDIHQVFPPANQHGRGPLPCKASLSSICSISNVMQCVCSRHPVCALCMPCFLMQQLQKQSSSKEKLNQPKHTAIH